MSTIKLKNSIVPGERPVVAPLDGETNELILGEIAINTHDGKMFMRKDQDGSISLQEVGQRDIAENVFYVSKIGDDSNDGKTIGTAFASIEQALLRATPATITFDVRSGATIDIDVASNTIHLPGHVFDDGDEVIYKENLGSYSSLTNGQQYFIRKYPNPSNLEILREKVQLYTTRNGAISGLSADLVTLAVSGLGGAHSLTRDTKQTTIFVKSGTYTLNNAVRGNAPMGGIVVPKNVSIVGDNLRTTRVKGSHAGNDLFYVQNASYITNLTFEGMQRDASQPRDPAAVSFPPIALQEGGVANPISTSPYIENCTAFNTTATGMLIDGSLTTGLRSMVSDSFTQINAGGTGVHIVNRGYAQLVSIFTVSCDHAVLCESGGQCSLTNSNASFGNFGLKATGASESLYRGVINANAVPFGDYLEITTPTPPKYGDAFLVNDVDRQLISKCSRDTGLIVDAVAQDLALQTNFKSIYAGIAYQRKNALADAQMVEDTANALLETKRLVGLLEDVIPVKTTTDTSFDVITNIIKFGTVINDAGTGNATQPGSTLQDGLTAVGTVPALTFVDVLNRGSGFEDAKDRLKNNRAFLQEEITAYIAANHSSLTYNTNKCKRDVGYIVDALQYDLMYGGNSATTTAAESYFVGATSQLGAGQKTATVDAYGRLADVCQQVILGTTVTESPNNPGVQNTSGSSGSASAGTAAHDLVEIIKGVIDDGDLEALPATILPAFPTTGTNADAKAEIDSNRRALRNATTDWVIINTGSTDDGSGNGVGNVYYTVEGIQSSLDFTGTDFNGNDLPIFNSSGVLTASDTISLTSHGWKQGQPVKFTKGLNAAPGGLVDDTVYFIKYVTGDSFKLATNSNDIDNSIQILSTQGTGNHTLTPKFFYNTTKCQRDVGLILDAVKDDVLLGTNFNAVYTGIAYQRASAYTTVTNSNQKNPTIASMLDTKRLVGQLSNVSSDSDVLARANHAFDEIIHIFEDGTVSVSEPGDGVADALFLPNTLNASAAIVTSKDELIANRLALQNFVINEVATNHSSILTSPNYNEAKCRRDVGYIVDALCYDLLYNTNSATLRVAESYYITNDAGQTVAQLGTDSNTVDATEAVYTSLKSELANVITDAGATTTAQALMDQIIGYIDSVAFELDELTDLSTTGVDAKFIAGQTAITDNKSQIQATSGQGIDVYRVTPLEDVRDAFLSGHGVNFRKRSLIAASSMTFEYVGTGIEIQGLTDAGANTDDLYNRPRTNDFPKTENEVIFDEDTNLGAVYFTSTDHKGDFRIGSEMRINRTAGRIEGNTFDRSLFSVMTPYILAIEGN